MLARDPLQSIADAYAPVRDEVDVELPLREGALPPGLRGMLYRNGAGRVEVEGVPQRHPFDGDGMVSRFELGPSGVRYRNRYVRTAEFVAERAAGTMLYRAFGTNIPGGPLRNALRLKFKNAANTSVHWHGGRLLALWEAGVPHELDPTTLETRGRFDYHGQLAARGLERFVTPELPFSAHPTECPRTGELHNFGVQLGAVPRLLVHRASPDGRSLTTRRIPLPRMAFMHDFVLTERFAVFFATPVHFDLVRALSGLASPVESIRRDPAETTQVLIVPRDGGPVRTLRAPTGFFVFHFFGGYEDGERVVVHGCRMPDFQGGQIDVRDPAALRRAPFDPAALCRWTIDLGRGTIDERLLPGPPLELPTIDRRFSTRPHRVGFATLRLFDLAIPLYTGLGRIDLTTGEVRSEDFAPDLPGEPVFVPRHAAAPEGDGWLLSVVYRTQTHRSELWVLDAETLARVARFELPHHQPPGFHGTFVPA